MGRILNAGSMMFRADKETRLKKTKTIEARAVIHVATQESTRSKKKRTVYVYKIEGTKIIVFNRSRDGTRFMKIAIRPQNMQKFYEIFAESPLTTKEQKWLDNYGYKLV